MKTTILADGTLSIAPESDIEAFALNCWSKENITGDWYDVRCHRPKIILDLSAYAERMGLFVSVGGLKA
jgi:hypothetical protein